MILLGFLVPLLPLALSLTVSVLVLLVVLLLVSLGIPGVARLETWKLDFLELRPRLDFLLDCRCFASPAWRYGELWEDIRQVAQKYVQTMMEPPCKMNVQKDKAPTLW